MIARYGKSQRNWAKVTVNGFNSPDKSLIGMQLITAFIFFLDSRAFAQKKKNTAFRMSPSFFKK